MVAVPMTQVYPPRLMMTLGDILRTRSERLVLLLPALAATAALAVVGLRGPLDPFSLLVIALASGWTLVQTLQQSPVVILWLIPVSLSVYAYLPVQHYEILVFVVAALMLASRIREGDWPRIVLQPLEVRYLVFLATTLLGVPAAMSVYRYGGALKIYVVGLLAFEITRRAARRFGRATLLWGPVTFVAITVAQLALRFAGSGVPVFKSILLRSYLSLLPWGSSNYVSAVMVLCLPGVVLLFQESAGRPLRQAGVLAIILASLATMLFTLSRGGFVTSAVYLAWLMLSGRRIPWKVLIGFALAIALVAVTPLGHALLERFTNGQSQDSLIARGMIWNAALERGIKHLPFGIGLGQGWLQTDALQNLDCHDFPLTLFSETGPLGLLAWLWMYLAAWRAAGRLAKAPASAAAGFALRATLVLAFLNSLFEPTFTGNLYHLLFWWLVGIYHGTGEPADVPVRAPAP